jgi:hypothetical protein
MAGRGRRPKPVGSSPFAPVGIATPNRTEQWRACQSKFVDVLLRISDGEAAYTLAKSYWPFLWDSEHADPQRIPKDQHVARTKAPREAVMRWLRTHGRHLLWRLELAGNWRLGDEPWIVQGENVTACREWAKTLRNTSDALSAYLETHDSSEPKAKAEKWLRALYANQIPEIEPQMGDALSDPRWYADHFNDVADDIDAWLEDNDSDGGANRSARVVAALVAKFFDEIIGAEKVKLSRNQFHEPSNEYSKTVAAALVALGLPRGGWRRSVESICDARAVLSRHP